MRLHRFFVGETLPKDGDYTLSSNEIVQQISRVFRLGVGDSIILFCGDGFDYIAEIREVSKQSLLVRIIERRESVGLPRINVTLCQSIIKKDNCEWVAEKATELGVSSITFITSDRSEKKGINIERMGSIVREASEQCGRSTVPHVSGPYELEEVLARASNPILFDVGGEVLTIPFLKTLSTLKHITLFVGPEGGWSDADKGAFKKAGARVISLPGNVLRAETAATAVLALTLLAPLD